MLLRKRCWCKSNKTVGLPGVEFMVPMLILVAVASVLSVALFLLSKRVLLSLAVGTFVPCLCFRWLSGVVNGSDPFDQWGFYISLVVVALTNLASLTIAAASDEEP